MEEFPLASLLQVSVPWYALSEFQIVQVGADVYIDDQKVGHIDARAADNTINNYQKAWSSEKLSDGQHTIKLVPTGT